MSVRRQCSQGRPRSETILPCLGRRHDDRREDSDWTADGGIVPLCPTGRPGGRLGPGPVWNLIGCAGHMHFAEKQAALLHRLRAFRTSQERLSWLVAGARERGPLPAELRREEWRVVGCLSKLWVVGELVNGRCRFRCDSDSVIVKALAGLLIDLADDETPEALLGVDPAFLEAPELRRLLTSNRQNALNRVWEHLRGFALDHAAPDPTAVSASEPRRERNR